VLCVAPGDERNDEVKIRAYSFGLTVVMSSLSRPQGKRPGGAPERESQNLRHCTSTDLFSSV
jgi:hypothetical protein